MRLTKDQLRKRHICTRCESRPAAEGQSNCKRCRTSQREANRARYARLKAAGLCSKCEERHSVHGLQVCEECREAEKKRSAKVREDRRAANLCFSCGKRPLFTLTLCAECRDRKNNSGRGRKERGPGYVPPIYKKRVPMVILRAIDEIEDALFMTDPGPGRQIMIRVRRRLLGQQFPDSLVGQWLQPEMVGRCA